MKLNYDNLDDVKTKLLGTYCLYKGKAFVVKTILQVNADENKYLVGGSSMFNGRAIECDLHDPEFNCSSYNIGYVNFLSRGAWFYRVPMKQWRQGLRNDQVRLRCSQRPFGDIEFRPGKPLSMMLENTYPSIEDAERMLKGGDANIVAFHKNFAMTYDRVHGDFIIEYKGSNIGHTDLKEFRLMSENKHLMEALKEAVGG